MEAHIVIVGDATMDFNNRHIVDEKNKLLVVYIYGNEMNSQEYLSFIKPYKQKKYSVFSMINGSGDLKTAIHNLLSYHT